MDCCKGACDCCRDESDEARSRQYHHTFKEKNKQVSVNDDQRELYGVQEGFEVAQFDPERVAKILKRQRQDRTPMTCCGRVLPIAWMTFGLSSTSRRVLIWPLVFLIGYYIIQGSYQFENALLCKFSQIDVPQDDVAKNASSSLRYSAARKDCYKDIKVKFGEWGDKSKLIIRIITFLLGFYVSTIFKQYRSKIDTIPDAENPVLEIGGLANERTEDTFKEELVSPVGVTEWKRTMARYCLLSWTMCFNTISQPLASKLGTGDQLIEKGLLTKEELTALVGPNTENEDLASLSSDLWWIPIAWALNLVNKMGIHAEPSQRIIQKDHNKATGALVKFKMGLEAQKMRAETRLPDFYKRTLHWALYFWVFASMGMSQDDQHWREMVETTPDLDPSQAKLLALIKAFPLVTMVIQMTLLGWLFIADILDNPYGFNVDYDKNLEEELELNIWRCSMSLQQQAEGSPDASMVAKQKEKIWEMIAPATAKVA
jgi:hypothetical protein